MFLTCASVKVQCAKKFMTIIHMSDFTLPPSAWWTGSTSFELEAQEAIATSEASARLVLTKFRRKVRKRELCGEDAALHFIAPQIRPSVPAQVRLTRAADARSARRSVCGDGKPQSWPPGWDPLSGDPRYMTWPSRIRRGGGGGGGLVFLPGNRPFQPVRATTMDETLTRTCVSVLKRNLINDYWLRSTEEPAGLLSNWKRFYL